MIRKCRIALMFIVFFVVYTYGSMDVYRDIMYKMYKAEAVQSLVALPATLVDKKKESNEPSIISLPVAELSYHHSTAIMLLYQYGANELMKKMKMIEIHESYGRVLYKVETKERVEENSDKTPREFNYYIYVFLDRNIITEKFSIQHLHVVCVWENSNEAILNSGFKKSCTADNNWLYWKKGNCPDILYLERELEKAFNFEQIEKSKRKKV